MSKTPFRIKFVSSLIILTFITTFMASSAVAALADEKVEISLSAAAPRKAVALVPSYDYPSVTINSKNPVDIFWRDNKNTLIEEFNIDSPTNASYEYPYHIKSDYSPLTTKNQINYGDTSWLIFNSTSSQSYGDYVISTNHSASAIDDNGEETFFVQPDYNLHLRISVGSTGPVSIRLNFFPDKPTNYNNYNLFDPNGAKIVPYKFSSGDDEYICFVAEKTGDYSIIFNPIDEPLFYNIKCQTYKPETLKIEDDIKPIVVGLPDSELTDEEKKHNPLTLDWYKFNPREGQITRTYFEDQRGSPIAKYFTPGLNNTEYIGNVGVHANFANKKATYVLVRHDGLARYLIGIEDLEPEELDEEVYVYKKLAADRYKVFTFSVFSTSSMRVDLFSEDSEVKVKQIVSIDGTSIITSTHIDSAANYRGTNFFVTPGDYSLIVQNTVNREVWMNLRLGLNSLEEPINFSLWENMETGPDSVNFNTDTTVYELSVADIPGFTQSRIFNLKSTFEDEHFQWKIFWGARYNDSNDLLASHAGQDISVYITFTFFGEINGDIQLLERSDTEATISTSDDEDHYTLTVQFHEAMTSDTGNYWMTMDSYMENDTDILVYENYIRLAAYNVQDYYYNVNYATNFTNSEASLTNIKINSTRYPEGAIIKIPASGFNWTEVEVHTLNGTMIDGMILYTDIPNVYNGDKENVILGFDLEQNPNNPDELGNYTTGYGAPTHRDYIYLVLLLDPSNIRKIVTFNLTLRSLPTSILSLEKENRSGGRAPGFEWLLSIFGLGTVVYIIRNKKKKL